MSPRSQPAAPTPTKLVPTKGGFSRVPFLKRYRNVMYWPRFDDSHLPFYFCVRKKEGKQNRNRKRMCNFILDWKFTRVFCILRCRTGRALSLHYRLNEERCECKQNIRKIIKCMFESIINYSDHALTGQTRQRTASRKSYIIRTWSDLAWGRISQKHTLQVIQTRGHNSKRFFYSRWLEIWFVFQGLKCLKGHRGCRCGQVGYSECLCLYLRKTTF